MENLLYFSRQALESAVDQLKQRLQETSNSLEDLRQENSSLVEEHDRLTQRHSRLLSDMEVKEKHWKDRCVCVCKKFKMFFNVGFLV